ncbi:hypothetical protein K439DRAFT_1634237 [Ramaria rubella]|nr:hypothetical protein K439DRAFT_1634237 [Ramaria rubella]
MVVLTYVSSRRPDITVIRTRTHPRTLFASTTPPHVPSTEWKMCRLVTMARS